MRRSGALYQVINRKERRRAEARLLSPDQRRDFDEARRLGKSRLGAEDLVRTHHIEPCADASGPRAAINPPQGHREAEAGGARPCLRCFPPASLPFNATAPFRANPLFYLERARGFEPPTGTEFLDSIKRGLFHDGSCAPTARSLES